MSCACRNESISEPVCFKENSKFLNIHHYSPPPQWIIVNYNKQGSGTMWENVCNDFFQTLQVIKFVWYLIDRTFSGCTFAGLRMMVVCNESRELPDLWRSITHFLNA